MVHLCGVVVAQRGAQWPINVPGYRGVDCGHWWPLASHCGADDIAAALTNRLQHSVLSHPAYPAWPSVSADNAFLSAYVSRCDALGLNSLYGLACSSTAAPVDTAPEWLAQLWRAAEPLGFDVAYPSGDYSFINGDYCSADGKVMEYLRLELNNNGLFPSAEQARDFMRLHEEENERGADLETLDDALILELHLDRDLALLREALRTRSTCR